MSKPVFVIPHLQRGRQCTVIQAVKVDIKNRRESVKHEKVEETSEPERCWYYNTRETQGTAEAIPQRPLRQGE